MRKYLRVYKTLLKLNLSVMMAYRAYFYNGLFSSLLWGIFSIASIMLLTHNAKVVYGWKQDELFLLTGAYSIVVGFFHMIFSRNFDRFSTIIDRGQLDFVLIKPIDSQFLMSFWLTGFTSIFRVILGIVYIFYILSINHISVGVINILSFFILMILGVGILYSLWYIAATIMIWHPRLSNIIEFMFSFNNVTRYPPEMFYSLKNFAVFFLLPFTFVVATPTKVLLHKALLGDLAGLVGFSIFLLLISRWFWKFALKYYTSASS